MDRRFKWCPEGIGPNLKDGVQSIQVRGCCTLTEVPKEEGHEQLQEHIDKCTEWAKQWMMEFNVAKCKVLHAGRTNIMKEYILWKERFLRKYM